MRPLPVFLLCLLAGLSVWSWRLILSAAPALPAKHSAVPLVSAAPTALSPADQPADAPPAATNIPPFGPSSAAPAPTPRPAPESLADILEQAGSLADPAERRRVVAALRTLEDRQRASAEARARELGWPLRVALPGGRVREIVRLDDDGRPVYEAPENASAAISTGANVLRLAPFGLTGEGVSIGLWESGGMPRATHREFGGRVILRQTDKAASSHATHVAGTLAAAGLDTRARGMAPAALIEAYDSTNDKSEMAAVGAATGDEPDKILLSNHSYGPSAGWESNDDDTWTWLGTGTTATSFAPTFGRYGSSQRDMDALAYATPYYLIFRAAGNHRNDAPPLGAAVYLSPATTETVPYDPALHPPGDGVYRGGYDCMNSDALAKNVLAIGSTADAVTSGVRDLAKAALSSFSSAGPTDDGRIKPDLVANGSGLFSSISTSDTAYEPNNGTSMSSPNACGSAALLVQLQRRLFPGSALRSSTLKGLMIHTADDLGTAGPDYRYGWGLLNVIAAADLLQDHAAHPAKLRVGEDFVSAAQPEREHAFTWDGVSPLRVTLCWTDPAGTSTSTADSRVPRLVHNLDLQLINPTGFVHLPYVMPFVGTWTQASMALPATIGINNTDNVEQVHVASPAQPGIYRVRVSFQGTLTQPEQYYSLLVSGSALPPTAFERWTAGHALAGASAAANADPDADGLPNVVEFALGADPATADAAPFAPRLSSAGDRWKLHFTLSAEAVGTVDVFVQTSTDLVTWTDYLALPAAAGSAEVLLPPRDGPDRQFARLRVVLR